MNYKIKIAFLLAALVGPGASALALSDPQPQPTGVAEGFVYASGRSYLGINVQDVSKERVAALKLKEERGVEVTMVDQDAPASKAGLKEHDVILEFNGSRVESEEQFRRMVREIPPGRTVTLGISRDGSPQTIQVQLGDRGKIEMGNRHSLNNDHWQVVVPPGMTELPEMPDFNIDVLVPTYTPSLGIQADTLGQQLGEYFGVKGGGGVLVKSVEKGSVAEKAGMKAGDVITKIANEKIADRSDLRRILRSHREGGKLNLAIVRDKHEQNIVVDVPAGNRPRNSSSIEWDWPDFESFQDFDSAWDSWEPEILDNIHTKIKELQPKIRRAQIIVAREVEPEIKRNLKQNQIRMENMRKELLRESIQMRKQIHQNFI
jgi:membrane-associated protease RseP (regulator of RpoE activity)